MEKINNKSPKLNFVYNLIYQLLVLIIPLIISPYLSRIIGANGVGIYSYTYSIVYYFMLLTLLGVNNYGNRTIAKVRDNKEELSKTFLGIFSLQLIMGIIMFVAYLIYVFTLENQYTNIALLQSLFIISAILDINWFYFGLEEFKKTITRNIIVKISSLILIILLVKEQGDVWKYTLIMSATTVLSQVFLWGFVRKKISFVKIEKEDIKKHIKPNLVLFIPVIAISLYKIMDKIMLGVMANTTEVGFYENAEKISQIPMTIITALGTVMLPRISNMVAKGENERVEEYIKKSTRFIMFMAYAMCAGLICVGDRFAPVFFGQEFRKSGTLIMLLATTIPFLSIANVVRTQFLIPKEKDKIYIVSVILGAVLNLIMNIIFIPMFASVGACFGTIAAEFIVMFYQIVAIKKEINIFKILLQTIPTLIKAIIMALAIYPIGFSGLDSITIILLQIIVGIVVYAILNIRYIGSILNLRKILNKIK